MTTFSQMVDELIAESRRPEHAVNIAAWINQTVRNLHTDDNGVAAGLSDNLVEVSLLPDVDSAYVYTIPSPHLYQMMNSVYYVGRGVYAIERNPSSAYAFSNELHADAYYYRTGPAIAFSGYGGINAEIKLAFFQYPRKLTYYAVGSRPCEWSEVDQAFAYATAYDVDDTTRADAQTKSTNWILFRHSELVKQGVRQKLYARLADDQRAKTAYSMWKADRPGFFSAELTRKHPL